MTGGRARSIILVVAVALGAGRRLPIMLDLEVLVLNRVFLPVQVTTARRAFRLLLQGKARAILPDYTTFAFEHWLSRPLDGATEWVGLVTGRVAVPRVIVLGAYSGVPRHDVRFSRRNVFLRDGHRCQYCGQARPVRDLNLDHVLPLSLGGASSWENVVCCCVACNRRKGNRTPERAGMQLLRRPRRPRWHPLHEAVGRRRRPPAAWSSFVDPAILAWMPADGGTEVVAAAATSASGNAVACTETQGRGREPVAPEA